jgi:hypothetical protein
LEIVDFNLVLFAEITLHFLFTTSAKGFSVYNHVHVQIALVKVESPFLRLCAAFPAE